MLNDIENSLWEGCIRHIKLFVAVKMLSIKSNYNVHYGYFHEMMKFLKEINLEGNLITPNI